MLNKIKNRWLGKIVLSIGIGLGVVFTGVALAGVDPVALTAIAGNVDKSVKQLATVLVDICLIAGIGFIMGSFFKFHQHKLNPTQVPISQGVTLLLIGAGLTLFPIIIPTATTSVFGSDAKVAHTGGSEIHSLISG